jgi:hypothetical protein
MFWRSLSAVILSAGFISLALPVTAQVRAAKRSAAKGCVVAVSGRNTVAMNEYTAGEPTQKADGEATTYATAGPVPLGSGAVRVSLSPTGKASPEGGGLGAHVGALRPGRRIYLVVRGLRAEEPPGVIYHLYLDLPAGAKPARTDARYVGSLSFFDAANFEESELSRASFRSFDITDTLRNLRSRRLLGERSTLTIIPGGMPATSTRLEIGRVELVEQ